MPDLRMLKQMQEREDKLRTRPISEILGILNRNSIDLSEEQILRDYQELKDIEALSTQYYGMYEKELDLLDEKNLYVNSDAIPHLILRIIPEHFDLTEIGDPGFIDEWLMNIGKRRPPHVTMQELANIVCALINHARRTGISELKNTGSVYNYNAALRSLFANVTHPEERLEELLVIFYQTFPDADPNICPTAYQSWKARS
jgi:hypothetical protein